jgi:predicted MFS family arabinose efflux permease
VSKTKVSAWAPLANPGFRALWVAGLVSNVGALMHEVGEGWLMTTLSRSPLHVALLQAADGIAMLLLALPAGTVADIVDRRRLAISTQLWLFFFTALMAAFTALGFMKPHLLIALAFAMGLGSAVDEPIWQSLTSDSVPRPQLTAAVTLGGISINIARTVGPALGGVVVGVAGPAATFAINAVTFLWVAFVMFRRPRATRKSNVPTERWIGGIFAGLRYVRHSPPLVSALVRCACVIGPASCLTALLPIYARREIGLSSSEFGILLACMGIGALAAAWTLPLLRERATPDGLLAIAAFVFAAALCALFFSRSLIPTAAAMIVAGAGWMSMLSSLNVAAQTATAGWVRTRVLAIYLVTFQGALALGSILWGEVASRVGTRTALLAGAVTLLVLLLARLRFRLPSEEGDFTPSVHWPTPKLVCNPHDDDGPVLVLVDYSVPLEHAAKFARALRALEHQRRRDGAIQWDFYRDPATPTRWIESYVTDSWGEHVRQHARVTEGDRKVEDAVRNLLEPGTTPIISHLISGESAATANWPGTQLVLGADEKARVLG